MATVTRFAPAFDQREQDGDLYGIATQLVKEYGGSRKRVYAKSTESQRSISIIKRLPDARWCVLAFVDA